MPLLKLETNVSLSEEKRSALLSALSKIVAETIGKPETYVMVTIGPVAGLMAGKPGGAAFIDIRSIGGLNNTVNRQLSAKVCGLLQDALGVPPDRVYLNFSDVQAVNWGWNSSTFG
ncbi:MAG: phenylpyruvate tautomerase MIF-related protein [Limisphaerales bacterium]